MIWRLDWLVGGERRPVEIRMSLSHIDERERFVGEVRVEGYDAPQTVFPIAGVDWCQAQQMLSSSVWFFLRGFHRRGRLVWRGTDHELAIPAWRLRGGGLFRDLLTRVLRRL